MAVAVQILIALVGLLHIYFLVLEMFLWKTPKAQKAFAMTADFAQSTAVMAANQGLYNGFLAAGLIYSLIASVEVAAQFQVFFLSCVFIAGVYGGYSVGNKIFLMQGLPALMTLILIFLMR